MFEKYHDLMTVQDICDMLRISRRTVATMLTKGELPSSVIRGRRLVPKGAAIAWYLKQPKLGNFPEPPDEYKNYPIF